MILQKYNSRLIIRRTLFPCMVLTWTCTELHYKTVEYILYYIPTCTLLCLFLSWYTVLENQVQSALSIQ